MPSAEFWEGSLCTTGLYLAVLVVWGVLQIWPRRKN